MATAPQREQAQFVAVVHTGIDELDDAVRDPGQAEFTASHTTGHAAEVNVTHMRPINSALEPRTASVVLSLPI